MSAAFSGAGHSRASAQFDCPQIILNIVHDQVTLQLSPQASLFACTFGHGMYNNSPCNPSDALCKLPFYTRSITMMIS